MIEQDVMENRHESLSMEVERRLNEVVEDYERIGLKIQYAGLFGSLVAGNPTSSEFSNKEKQSEKVEPSDADLFIITENEDWPIISKDLLHSQEDGYS